MFGDGNNPMGIPVVREQCRIKVDAIDAAALGPFKK